MRRDARNGYDIHSLPWDLMVIYMGDYRWPIEIDDLPIKNGWIFYGKLLKSVK